MTGSSSVTVDFVTSISGNGDACLIGGSGIGGGLLAKAVEERGKFVRVELCSVQSIVVF